MSSKNNRFNNGFTLVEVLVSIAVIALLATIATLGLNSFLAQGRDGQRSANVTSISEGLEGYFDKNGEYPSCSIIASDPGVLTKEVLGGINADALLAPSDTVSSSNSLACQTLTATGRDFYEYKGDSSVTCQEGQACLTFKLRYREEATKEIKEVDSRRSVPVSTSGIPDIAANGTDFDKINVGWNAVLNATGYTLQTSRNNTFTNIVSTQTYQAYSTTVSSLNYNTAYFFRVRAESGTGSGPWSTIVTSSTNSLSAPGSLAATATSTSQINTTWSAVTGATSYRIEWSTSSTFASVTGFVDSITTTTRSVTGLSEGTQYYFRVRGVWNGNSGPWSTVATATTQPGTPTNVTIAAAMSGANAVGTAGATCAAGSPQFQLDTSNSNTTTAGAWAGWSSWSATTTRSVAASQGYQYVFRAQARCVLNGVAGDTAASSTANVVRPIAAPAAPGITKSASGTYGTEESVTWTWTSPCPAGTTPTYSSAYYRDDATGWRAWTARGAATTQVQPTSAQGYQYGVKVRAICSTDHTDSTDGAESANVTYIRQVDAPGQPGGFNLSYSTTQNGSYRYDTGLAYWTTMPTCDSGLTRVFRMQYKYWSTIDNAGAGQISAVGSMPHIFVTNSSTPVDNGDGGGGGDTEAGRQAYLWKTAWEDKLQPIWRDGSSNFNPSSEYWADPTKDNSPYLNWIPTETKKAGIVNTPSASYGDSHLKQMRVYVRYACYNNVTNRYALGLPGTSSYKYF